jgi:hypothetical protein
VNAQVCAVPQVPRPQSASAPQLPAWSWQVCVAEEHVSQLWQSPAALHAAVEGVGPGVGAGLSPPADPPEFGGKTGL